MVATQVKKIFIIMSVLLGISYSFFSGAEAVYADQPAHQAQTCRAL